MLSQASPPDLKVTLYRKSGSGGLELSLNETQKMMSTTKEEGYQSPAFPKSDLNNKGETDSEVRYYFTIAREIEGWQFFSGSVKIESEGKIQESKLPKGVYRWDIKIFQKISSKPPTLFDLRIQFTKPAKVGIPNTEISEIIHAEIKDGNLFNIKYQPVSKEKIKGLFSNIKSKAFNFNSDPVSTFYRIGFYFPNRVQYVKGYQLLFDEKLPNVKITIRDRQHLSASQYTFGREQLEMESDGIVLYHNEVSLYWRSLNMDGCEINVSVPQKGIPPPKLYGFKVLTFSKEEVDEFQRPKREKEANMTFQNNLSKYNVTNNFHDKRDIKNGAMSVLLNLTMGKKITDIQFQDMVDKMDFSNLKKEEIDPLVKDLPLKNITIAYPTWGGDVNEGESELSEYRFYIETFYFNYEGFGRNNGFYMFTYSAKRVPPQDKANYWEEYRKGISKKRATMILNRIKTFFPLKKRKATSELVKDLTDLHSFCISGNLKECRKI